MKFKLNKINNFVFTIKQNNRIRKQKKEVLREEENKKLKEEVINFLNKEWSIEEVSKYNYYDNVQKMFANSNIFDYNFEHEYMTEKDAKIDYLMKNRYLFSCEEYSYYYELIVSSQNKIKTLEK